MRSARDGDATKRKRRRRGIRPASAIGVSARNPRRFGRETFRPQQPRARPSSCGATPASRQKERHRRALRSFEDAASPYGSRWSISAIRVIAAMGRTWYCDSTPFFPSGRAVAILGGYRPIILVAECPWGRDRVSIKISGQLHSDETVARKGGT